MGVSEHGRLEAALGAVERAFAAGSQQELNAVMAAAFADFGVAHFNATRLRDSEGALAGGRHFGHAHGDWSAHYIGGQLYRRDHLIPLAIAGPSPLWWSQTKTAPTLTPKEQALYGEAGAFGMRDGFITPVHNADGSISMITLTASEKLELSLVDQTALRLLSLYYYSFGMALTRNAAMAKLTERQRECLKWVRAGKTSWEISTILRISERTVIFHISAACRRLGVQTRAQAVVEAVVQGLIAP